MKHITLSHLIVLFVGAPIGGLLLAAYLQALLVR